MNKLVKVVEKQDLYREFLKSINGILQLTDRELDLLLILIDIYNNLPKLPDYSKNIISTENRKYIKTTTGITSDNLSRYLTRFKSKGILVKGKVDDEWLLNPAVIPEVIGDRIQVTIILKTNEYKI